MSGFFLLLFLPVWSDLDVILVLCRFAHILQGSISDSEMRSLKSTDIWRLVFAACHPKSLALTQTKDVVSNISRDTKESK